MSITLPTASTRRLSRAAASPAISDEVEAWLHDQPSPEAPVQWRFRGRAGVPVRSREQLGIRITRLRRTGAWGVAARTDGGRWGQVMRMQGGWIVEVNGIPGPECFARRVSTGGLDLIAKRDDAVDVLWAWLVGRLLPGYQLVDL